MIIFVLLYIVVGVWVAMRSDIGKKVLFCDEGLSSSAIEEEIVLQLMAVTFLWPPFLIFKKFGVRVS
jgi:hypothetical protein